MNRHTPSSLFDGLFSNRLTRPWSRREHTVQKQSWREEWSAEPDGEGLPESEHERFAQLRKLLAQEPSVALWHEIRELLDTWGSSPMFTQAWELTRHYLDVWPPGLRKTSLLHQERPSFGLADCLNARDYDYRGTNVRRQHFHITCHTFDSGFHETQSEREARTVEGLGEIRRCRSLEFEHSVNDLILEAVRRFEELEVLKVEDCLFVNSLQPLETMNNLKVLILKSNNSLENLNLLLKTPHLQHLRLNRFNGLKDIYGLENCTELRSLVLRSCPNLEDAGVLEHCTRLEHLELLSCGVSCLNSLLHLSHLKNLRLKALEVEELSFLNGLQELEELVIEDCKSATCFQSLGALENLHSLRLENLVWDDSLLELSGLEQLEHLELIQIEGMEDLRCLEGLYNLKSLRIQGSPSLVSFEGLESLSSLEKLQLEHTSSVEDLEPLSHLASLRELRLEDGTFVFPASWSLERWREVEQLRAAGEFDEEDPHERLMNELTEEELEEHSSLLRQVASLRNLEFLSLVGMPDLPGIECLAELPYLQRLELRECGVRRWDIEGGFSALKRMKVFYCKELQTLRFLTPLPSLCSLTVIACRQLNVLDTSTLTELEELDLENARAERHIRRRRRTRPSQTA
jgi:hypothetical protein